MPILLPLLFAALSAGKAGVDQGRANKQTDLAAETDRYSPWTGKHGEVPQYQNPFGTILGGIGTGIALGQGGGNDFLKGLMSKTAEAGGQAAIGAAGAGPSIWSNIAKLPNARTNSPGIW